MYVILKDFVVHRVSLISITLIQLCTSFIARFSTDTLLDLHTCSNQKISLNTPCVLLEVIDIHPVHPIHRKMFVRKETRTGANYSIVANCK